MFSELPRFWVDKPGWLLLLLLIIPAYFMARRSIGAVTRRKAIITFALRAMVISLLAVTLAEPNVDKRGKGVTAMILIDRSDSIPAPLKQESIEFLKKAAAADAAGRESEDRVGVIEVAKDSAITALPFPESLVPDPRDDGDPSETNLAEAVRTAMAIKSDDTAMRIILASDGNQTQDSVLKAAEVARANKIPIDVLLLEYEHQNEVIFERLAAPSRARMGQTVNVRMAVRSFGQASGRISLSLNGSAMDLNGPEEGTSLHVTLEPGLKVFPVPVPLDRVGAQRFDATFEPDDASQDSIMQNNRAVAVTFVATEGRVLVVEGSRDDSEPLIEAMNQSEIEVDRTTPEGMGDRVTLAAYDAIVLNNVPYHAFTPEQDRDLHNYVHDVGGGLVMLGGPNSFGAGRWLDTDVAKALPVKLDPPSLRQMMRGALAIIMHSCEMPQGNYWGEQVAIAAINALSSQDYIGILDFNWQMGGGGYNWAYQLQLVGDKSGAIAAAKQLVNGDMPDFDTTMQMAHDGLVAIPGGAAKKHVIIISDGDPSAPKQALINQYVQAGISCSTVMTAGHGTPMDRNTMQGIAAQTGGRFHPVSNPKNLPQIFIQEAKEIARSLIVEGEEYQPQVVSRLPGPIEGFTAVPSIDGYVLTVAREGLAQVPIVNSAMLDDQPVADPIYAHWNYGLGKSIAFTSSVSADGRWSSQWVSWDQFKAFWERSMRWVMRPSSPVNFMINTVQEGEKVIVDMEALESDASYMNFMKTSGIVLGPDGEREPLTLQQVGPGRYRGEFKAPEAGAYLVNMSYATGEGESATKGTVQAAVAVPYSREYRSVKHNAALLEQLADMTGGHALSMDDPALVNLFDRVDLEVPRSPKRIWDLLVILAAALFVIDVAARRISLQSEQVRALAQRTFGRRAQAGDQTMAAWKKARSQVAHRRADKTEKAKPGRGVKFEATDADAASAIDVGEQTGDQPQRPAEAPARRAETQESQQEESDYTSRLLAAKRRARQSDKDKKGPGAEGDSNA